MHALVDAVRGAAAGSLRIVGHGSKTPVLGDLSEGDVLDTTTWSGIEAYQPEELVVTVRAGTPLADLEAVLREHGQCLPFAPPRIGGRGTVGGAVASGLSGPTRPWWGSVRDAVLGVTLINGLGQALQFGGQVMKNVAGYDVSRLQAGALGAFGVIANVSLRVRPVPTADQAFEMSLPAQDAVSAMRRWCRQPLPLAGLCWHEGVLRWRLAGHAEAVAAAARQLGGTPADADYWQQLRDYALPLWHGVPLWRRQCAPATAADGELLIDWAGALRWSAAAAAADAVRFGSTPPQPTHTLALARRIKAAFDPQNLFNPGVLHADPAA